MNEEQLKSLVTDLMQPVYAQLTDATLSFIKRLISNMPKEMPVAEQKRIVTDLLKSHNETVQKNMKSSIPDDFADKLKEALKNGK